MPTKPSKMPADQDVDAGLEERIREKAYQLWQADGEPERSADQFWYLAKELLEKEAKTRPSKISASEKPNVSR